MRRRAKLTRPARRPECSGRSSKLFPIKFIRFLTLVEGTIAATQLRAFRECATALMDGWKGETMSDIGVQPLGETAPAGAGLTQWQRVADTFAAPSKTFEDIKRGNRSWWLPLIIGALASYILFAAVAQKITIAQVVDNQIRMDPKAQERLANASPEQREMGTKFSVWITEGAFIGGPVIGIIGAAVVSLVLWGTINFGFGGRSKYGEHFCRFILCVAAHEREGDAGDDCDLRGDGAGVVQHQKLCSHQPGRVSRSRGHKQGAVFAGDIAGHRVPSGRWC